MRSGQGGRRVFQDSASDRPVRAGEQPLVFVLLAACLGVALDRHLAISPSVWGVSLSLVLALWFLVRRGRPRGAAILVLGSVAALAGLWHHDRWQLFPADEIGRFAREEPAPVYVRGGVGAAALESGRATDRTVDDGPR